MIIHSAWVLANFIGECFTGECLLERSCLVSAAWSIKIANKQWKRACELRSWVLAEWLIMSSIKNHNLQSIYYHREKH